MAYGREATGARRTTALRVVVADDEKSLRDVIKEGLVELHGCRVRAVPDGESAIACLRSSHADILLLDLLMPGVDGFAVLKRLRSDAGIRACRPGRVVVMSAITGRDVVRTLRDLGADEVLTKPFSLAELRAALRLCPQASPVPRYERVAV